MPYRGWKTITVRDAVHEKLKAKAKEAGKSVGGLAEEIILEACK